MDGTDVAPLEPLLDPRYEEVAAEWQQALSRNSYIPLGPAEVSRRLVAMLQRAGDLLQANVLDAGQARLIGEDLANLHCLHSSTVGETVRIVGDRLLAGLPPEHLAVLQPRLVVLLNNLLAGYFERAFAIVLDEQEQTARALVSQLRAARDALREARDGLEQRVQDRTAELAQANEDLHREVAERQRAEQAARASEERWRSLVQHAPDMVSTIDREGRLTFINRVQSWSRTTPEALIGREAIVFLPEEWREVHARATARIFETGESVNYEVSYPAPDGTVMWRSVHGGPIWREGQVAEALFISRDVSEQKRLDEMKDNLIRDVSHELRTPLAKVQMSLELLEDIVGRDPIDGARAKRISELARRNAQRLLATVEGILDLSRLEASASPFLREPIDLHALVDDALHYMRSLVDIKGVNLTVSLPDRLPAVEGDRDKLFRVLINLVENAVKFSEGGQIAISARAQDEAVELAVADHGRGIRPENLERVFDRFFQEQPGAAGVGVGLTMCRNIVAAHGGRIWAESAGRGQGATFRFTLPIHGGAGAQ